jgi:L-ascorbate metabolism protein UlaG (beta-lactamase superfamily)
MRIHYLGHACFRIIGDQVEVVTDPFTGIGLPEPEAEADLVLCSHEHRDHSHVGKTAKNTARVLVGYEGKTECCGVKVKGIPSFHDAERGAKRGKNSIYVFDIEDITFCHLGDLGHELDDDTVDLIGTVEALFVPVGGFYTVGPEEANAVCDQLMPNVVIPMHYRSEAHSENFDRLHSVEDFVGLRETVIRMGRAPLDLDEEDLPDNATVVFEL